MGSIDGLAIWHFWDKPIVGRQTLDALRMHPQWRDECNDHFREYYWDNSRHRRPNRIMRRKINRFFRTKTR